MKLIKTVDAAGHILCHDLTEVIPGKSKGTPFRRGQIITAADIPLLLDMGKEQLYVSEKEDKQGMSALHEEEGAEKLRQKFMGTNMRAAPVREGKIELFAEIPGLLKIDSKKLIAINEIEGIKVITLRGNRSVVEGEKIAAIKIIPLYIEEEKLENASEICGNKKLINIIPFKQKKAALIVTGNELFKGRIPETGSEILKKKLKMLGAEFSETVILPDESEKITAKILEMIESGIDLVICTGGMSVDPDDQTPLAIKNTGGRIVSYGVPYAPGVMLLLSYYEKPGLSVPVIGAPACVFYEHKTALDVLLPRFLADDPISSEDLAVLGEGGLENK
jgi:molybdenum cofactor synthesis domain-containing protein